jgi:hypothetical protein
MKKFRKKIKKDDWFFKNNYLHFDCPLSYKHAKFTIEKFRNTPKHSFLPFLRFTIKSFPYKKDADTNKMKRTLKTREIYYSSHVDGYIYNYYAKELAFKYEEKVKEYNISDSVLAFRKLDKKNNIHFAKEAFDDIKELGECRVLALDFSKFFDTLSHDILKKKWSNLLGEKTLPLDHYKVYKSLTKFSYVDRDEVYKMFNISKNNTKNIFRICSIEDFREKVRKEKLIKPNPKKEQIEGIPQGSSLSALLSNIYMIDFDKEVKNYIENFNGKYYRYCDDILMILPLRNIDNIRDNIENKIKDLELTINRTKTVQRNFYFKNNKLCSDKPLQYLGFLFDGENISLRSSSLFKYHQKMKKSVKIAKKSKKKWNTIYKKNNLKEKKLYKRKLYEKYSHLGKRNFVRYGLRANEIMKSKSIKRQIKRLWVKLENEIEKKQ